MIMTSNAGSNESAGIYGFGTNPEGREERRAEQGLKNIFRPEFLNRIDEIIAFHSLTQQETREIASLQIREMVRQALANGIILDVSSEVSAYIAEKGYSRTYGARPIRRIIQKELEDPLSSMMIQGKAAAGNEFTVFVQDHSIVIGKK